MPVFKATVWLRRAGTYGSPQGSFAIDNPRTLVELLRQLRDPRGDDNGGAVRYVSAGAVPEECISIMGTICDEAIHSTLVWKFAAGQRIALCYSTFAFAYPGTFVGVTSEGGEVDSPVNNRLSIVLQVVSWPTEKDTQLHALSAAAWNGNVDTVSSLLDGSKVDVNHRFGGRGAQLLHIAASRHHLPVIRMLVQRGANVNGRSCNGMTPLIVAVKTRPLCGDERVRSQTINALLALGADPFARSGVFSWRRGLRGRESAFTLALNTITRKVGDLTIPLRFVAFSGAAARPDFWDSVVGRFLASFCASGLIALVGSGLNDTHQIGFDRFPAALFSTLIELGGGPSAYYYACCARMFSKRLGLQFAPDCSLRELTESEGGLHEVALDSMRQSFCPDLLALSLNAASTRLGALPHHVPMRELEYARALVLQRPGCYEFAV